MRKLAMILCVTSVSVTAQWPNRPPREWPERPMVSRPHAPAPLSADGKPDLSGSGWSGMEFYLTSDLKPEELRPWAATLYKQREDNFRRERTESSASRRGPKAGIGLGKLPIKIVQTADLVVVL